MKFSDIKCFSSIIQTNEFDCKRIISNDYFNTIHIKIS